MLEKLFVVLVGGTLGILGIVGILAFRVICVALLAIASFNYAAPILELGFDTLNFKEACAVGVIATSIKLAFFGSSTRVKS